MPRSLNPTPTLPPDATEEERFDAFDEIRRLTPSDRTAIYRLLKRAQAGDLSGLEAVYELIYDEIPVDVEEFMLGAKYLNLKGLVNQDKVDLMIYFDLPQVREVDILAGSGSGKGFIAGCAMARTIYKLVCLRRADLFYMLGPNSRIAVLNASSSKDQASDVVFTEFKARVEHSPWFVGRGFKAGARKARFPKRIYGLSVSSISTAVFGYHTMMGVMDEAAFMLAGETDLAPGIHTGLMKSLTTRFPGAYKLLVTSTIRDTTDFVCQRVDDVKRRGVRIRHRPLDPPPPGETY